MAGRMIGREEGRRWAVEDMTKPPRQFSEEEMAVWKQTMRDSNVKYYTIQEYEAMERFHSEVADARVQAAAKAQDEACDWADECAAETEELHVQLRERDAVVAEQRAMLQGFLARSFAGD